MEGEQGVIEIGRRHGVPPDQVAEVVGGVANRGFALGEKLFLRVARPGFEADLRKEVGVVPVARAAGVRTPEIIEYDESRGLIDAPYVVMERVHGIEPAEAPTGLGEQLARLHVAERTELPGVSFDKGGDDPWRTVEGLLKRGYLDSSTAGWLNGWFNRLAERFDRNVPMVLIHGDVAAHNLLAGPDGELRALIDWGDAAWAPPAMDFAKLPLEHVAAILPEYVHHHNALATNATTRDEELAAATLWFHLEWGLGKLTSNPWPGQRHWTAPPGSRLLELLRFFAGSPSAPWASLT
ncbi:phosphotransferase family enzyme [Kribbella antiqua]|uniref:Phosphotransferase family enzyme n=1 Tax=Kribbella antiqua TaxID=2512217 RepID=A0A4R2IGF8_9ACTN|nr:aminoglycoside phosphotransferase family protein [Kribbella antiqua]TCO43487.1 phosphotransferase family enzyme [Kribbella antiqua]